MPAVRAGAGGVAAARAVHVSAAAARRHRVPPRAAARPRARRRASAQQRRGLEALQDGAAAAGPVLAVVLRVGARGRRVAAALVPPPVLVVAAGPGPGSAVAPCKSRTLLCGQNDTAAAQLDQHYLGERVARANKERMITVTRPGPAWRAWWRTWLPPGG